MTKITAIIRSDKVRDVESALREAGAPGFTYYDVKGHGREVSTKTQVTGGAGEDFFITDIVADILPRVKFEIICKEADCSKTIDAIRKASVTGERGDGIIYTETAGNVMRIQTGEEGEQAL